MTDLNTDVLKRTAGLLASIDLTIRTCEFGNSTADRVERLLSSAVSPSSRLGAEFMAEHGEELLDLWVTALSCNEFELAYRAQGNRAIEQRNPCECSFIPVVKTETQPSWDEIHDGLPREDDDGPLHGPFFHEYVMAECSFYDPPKTYPLGTPGQVHDNTAAPMGCGIDGCVCEDVFDADMATYDMLLERMNESAAAHFATDLNLTNDNVLEDA